VRRGLWAVVAAALVVALGIRLWASPGVREWRYRRQPVPALQAAAERRPSDPVLRRVLGRKLLAAGRPGEAVAEFRRAADLDPQSVEALTGLGEALAATGQDDDAFAALQMSLARRRPWRRGAPKHGCTWRTACRRKRSRRWSGQPIGPLPATRRRGASWARLAPPWDSGRRGTGLGARRQPHSRRSRGASRPRRLAHPARPGGGSGAAPARCDSAQPSSPAGHTLLGSALAGRQPSAQYAAPAEAEFREALRLDPASQEAAYGLALLLLRERRGAAAIPLLADLVRRVPDSPRARFQYARALRETGRTAAADQAMRDYHRRAEAARLEIELRGRLTLRPDDPTLRARLSRLKRESGRDRKRQ